MATSDRSSATARRVPPSSSRMLSSFLGEIEHLLDAQVWQAAVDECVELPLIATALSDQGLRVRPQALREWCERWLPTARTDSAMAPPDPVHVGALALERLGGDAPAHEGEVPGAALRRLRLHRHLRPPPWHGPGAPATPQDPQASHTRALCLCIRDALRRWYAQQGCHDPVVQLNLARLAVLR